MPNRIIKESICESKNLSDCSFFSQDLYKRLITYADDYGRFNADPQIMLARLYPRDIDVVSQEDIIDGLSELAGVGKIAFYMGFSLHDKKVYGCFPNWADHQRMRESKKKCPDPSDTSINDWYLQRFVPISMKIALLERDKFCCAECGKRIAETENARAVIKMGAGLFHIDHIVPVNQGGRATMENLRVLCPKCNLSRKRFYSFDEILQFAESYGNSQKSAANLRRLPPESESESISESISNQNPKSRARADAAADDQLIADDDARQIQTDHDRVLNAAEDAGFKVSNSVRAALIRLYAANGLQKVLDGIASCVKHGAPTLAYLEACMKDKPKAPKPPKVAAQDFPQRDYSDANDEMMDSLAAEMEAFLSSEKAGTG